jgi:hypothetical protein
MVLPLIYEWVQQPVIAAGNGPVVGVGLLLALYCDLGLASDAARFKTAFTRRGLPVEIDSAADLRRITRMQLDDGYGAGDIHKIPEGNLHRVFVEVEKSATKYEERSLGWFA